MVVFQDYIQTPNRVLVVTFQLLLLFNLRGGSMASSMTGHLQAPCSAVRLDVARDRVAVKPETRKVHLHHSVVHGPAEGNIQPSKNGKPEKKTCVSIRKHLFQSKLLDISIAKSSFLTCIFVKNVQLVHICGYSGYKITHQDFVFDINVI